MSKAIVRLSENEEELKGLFGHGLLGGTAVRQHPVACAAAL
jgi:hypothetical protein